MSNIIDGKAISTKIIEKLVVEVSNLNTRPGLAVVIVGDDSASHIYVNNKEKNAKKIGFKSKKICLPENTEQKNLIKVIEELNNDNTIHGILVQSPLPKHIDENAIILSINPAKDVDCFHPINVGKMLIGEENVDELITPCTPFGCLVLLKEYGVDLTGKHCVVIGRSNIVGKPMAALLVQKNSYANATVSIVHSRTKNIEDIIRSADVVIAAIGKANFVKSSMIKSGAILIDVGINKVDDETKKSGFRLVGDIDFDNVKEKASLITPVPGGVGPMTIAMLMKNTLKAYKKLEKL